MTDERYQEFIDAVKALAAKHHPGEVTDFRLTQGEARAIAALPDAITDEIDKVLGQYNADGALDIRSEVVMKFIALLVMRLGAIEDGIAMGDEAGSLIVEAAGYKASA